MLVRVLVVGRKLFGDGYSGLEYDYRGLLRLYNAQGNSEKAAQYLTVLHEWNVLRDLLMHVVVDYDAPLQFVVRQQDHDDSLDDVVKRFLSAAADRRTTDTCPTQPDPVN